MTLVGALSGMIRWKQDLYLLLGFVMSDLCDCFASITLNDQIHVSSHRVMDFTRAMQGMTIYQIGFYHFGPYTSMFSSHCGRSSRDMS